MALTGPPPDPDQLRAAVIWLVETTEKAKYSVAASTAWLLYDLFITFEEELHTSDNVHRAYYSCPSRFVFEAVTCSILSISVQVSLMIRVYALWGRSRLVGICLVLGFIMGEVGNICMLCFGLRAVIPGLVPIPGLSYMLCTVTVYPGFYNLCWLPMLGFESFLFVMNTISCLRYGPIENTPTIERVLRDGTVYFAGIFVVLLLETVGAYFPASGLAEYLEPWLSAVFSFSGSHLLLSIRRLAAERRKRLELSGISTSILSTNKPTTSQTECAGIELHRLNSDHLNPAVQAREPSHHSSGTPGTAGGDAEVEIDIESGRVRHRSTETHSHSQDAPPAHTRELSLLYVPERSEGIDGDDGVSPADSDSLPPLELEPQFVGASVLDRLSRRWNLDWLADWEHQ
ncbi:hypothetical protein NM688_g5062 [Phlebia brevispora]|uniref:Uncharacterized protein n=1 Tax=Phlebia brevispora TaxID=194682 RepID=A0ACC1T138_9APHY|nr:hypothetical protein NM688_g5062 [Phlebia brevispora]